MPQEKPLKPTVQTLLAAKKGVNDTTKEKPLKQKRTHSDVAEDSAENVELLNIHSDLDEITKSLQGTLTKFDLDNALGCLVKKTDLKEIVTTIVNQLLTSFKETLQKDCDDKIRERTGKLFDKMDGLAIENEELRERIRAKDRTIEALEEKVHDIEVRSIEALKLGNYNEQYSRKHNIRILNYPEKKQENLRDDFIQLTKNDPDVVLSPDEIQAIHRIPGKKDLPRPVIVKVKNTEVKSRIMRNRKGLKDDVKFFDDITHRNIGLMKRLKDSGRFESVWFFNDGVFAKETKEGKRIRFDIFDNVNEKLRNK